MRRAACWISLGLAMSMGTAQAALPTEKQTDALTDALVTMIPLGQVMQQAAAADPNWPMQDKPEAVTKEQLACLRSELSVDGYRRFKRAEVVEYLKTNHANVDDEVRAISLAAPLFAKFMMAGAEVAGTGKEVDMGKVMDDADADQVLAMVSLSREPKYRELRELAGIGDMMDSKNTNEDNKAAGEMLAFKPMMQGMKTCKVSMGALM